MSSMIGVTRQPNLCASYGEGLADRVADLAPGGIDAALDVVGKGSVPVLVSLVDDPAQVVSLADFGAAQHGARVATAGSVATHGLAEAARLADENRFTVPIDSTFTLDQTADAHRRSESGHARGKIIVRI